MDLHGVENYLQPKTLQEVNWHPQWAWLAGGTWLFNEPQSQIKTLVDMQQLGWTEIDISPQGLAIGAMCLQNDLLNFVFPEDWAATEALKDAVRELASFKLSNGATVGGNLCLALSASTFAPVMVALQASYEIWHPQDEPYQVQASNFQTAPQQTILQPGEVLRKIWIPAENLRGWQTNFKRMAVATAGYAIAIVVTAYNTSTEQVRFGIGGSIIAPRLVEFASLPTAADIATALEQIPAENYLDDERASAPYRQHITKVLMKRAVAELTTGIEYGRRF